MKYLFLLLLLCIPSIIFSQDPDPLAPIEIEEEVEVVKQVEMPTILEVMPVSPEFPGGLVAMKNFIDSSFVYPENEVSNIKGAVYVEFSIDTLGQLDSFKVMKGLTPLIDKEALRVVRSFPMFTPYIFAGEKRAIHYTVPIVVNKEGQSLVKATYPGGENVMSKFIQENFVYPKVLWEQGGEGVIWTKVLIDMDGNISDVEVVRGLQVDFDKEFIRVIKLMPKWKPSQTASGIKVAAYVMIPLKI